MSSKEIIIQFVDFRLISSEVQHLPLPEHAAENADKYTLTTKFSLNFVEYEFKKLDEAGHELLLMWECSGHAVLSSKSGEDLPDQGKEAGFKTQVRFIQVAKASGLETHKDNLKKFVDDKQATFRNVAQIASHFYLKQAIEKTDFSTVNVPVDFKVKFSA